MSRDTLSDLLRSVRLRAAVFFYVSCRSRWAVESSASEDIAQAVLPGSEHVMEYHLIAKGQAWSAVAGERPIYLAEGDVVMFPQGDRHVISSAPEVAPVRREPEEVFAIRDHPKPLPVSITGSQVEVGKTTPTGDAETVAVCGFLGCDRRPFNPLVAALPKMLHLPASRTGGWVTRVIDQAVRESSDRRPGGDVVLERLSEMMFVDAARRYLDDLPEDATGWLAGLRDRFVGKALELLHA
ncbi:MAG: cupin domain-containing protein, partial [Burkholderiales bacterium]